MRVLASSTTMRCVACSALEGRPSSSLSKNTPGEGTGPTERVSSGEIPIGRVPPRGAQEVFQQALETEETPGSSLPVPLAMPARHYLESLNNNLSLADLTDRLRPLLARPATVSVARRMALLGASLALPLLIATISVVDSHLEQRFLQARPELASLRNCLDRHEMLQLRVQTGAIRETRVSDALEACIATRFAQVSTNQGAWKRFQTSRVIYDSQRQTAERIINTRSIPSTNALAEADAIVEQFFSEPSEAAALRSYLRINTMTVLGRGGYLLGLATVVLPCLLASLLFGGGLLTRVFGIAFVTRAGEPLSRWRLAWRHLIAWLPFLLLPIPARWLAPVAGDQGGLLLAEGVCVALGLVSALLPQRGLPDRITGAWPVPR